MRSKYDFSDKIFTNTVVLKITLELLIRTHLLTTRSTRVFGPVLFCK